ncbi:MAG: hypothetical protein HY941_10355 [Gammaproteobacteria bacterium]|nr:hypothetical protein [Gammaproteobacteria bacterium]
MNIRNSRKSLVLGCLLAVFGAALSSAADAACTQANMVGTWYSMGVSGDSYFGEMGEIDRCKLVVNSNNRVVASSSSCIYRDARGQFNYQVTGGTINVSSDCAVIGSINVCDSGYCNTIRIQYAQMARDKNTFSMVGYLTGDTDVVFFYKLVKQ